MYELPVEQKKAMVQEQIVQQARKAYGQEVAYKLNVAANASQSTIDRVKATWDGHKAAQAKAEAILAELEVANVENVPE